MRRRAPKAKIIATFTADELAPSNGSPVEDLSLPASRRTAKTVETYDGIYLQHPAHRRLFAQFDYLRELGLTTTGPKRALRVAGESGAGKTTAIEEYIKLDLARRTPIEGVLPVGAVKLDRACTTKRLMASCLEMYGDEYSDASVESVLRRRLYECVRRFGTELIFIDEVQHLALRSSSRSDPTDMLKRMLDDGVVPLVFTGNEDALPLMKRNIQLANRMIAPCDIARLDRRNPEDVATFRTFVRRLDEAMVERGLVRRSSDLADPRTLLCLFVVSKGLLGRVVNLVRAALEIATRRGADLVEPHDLSKATQTWAMPQAIIGYDPFSKGVPHV